MKRLLLILFLIITVSTYCYAAKETQPASKNQVVLDLKDEPSIFSKNKEVKENKKEENSLNLKYTKDLRQESHETLLYKDINHMQPEKKALSKTIDKNITENTSIGAKYNTTENAGELDDSVSVFSKYQKDKFSFTSAYGQSREGFKNNGADSGIVSFSPEVEINKHLSVKNVYSDNLMNNQTKNEVVMSVKPFKDDRMDVDLGAGQSFSTDNQPAKSQLNLTTKFRF